jgi:hypothetical protein
VELTGEKLVVRVLFYSCPALLASRKLPDVHFLLAMCFKPDGGKCSPYVLRDFPNEINDLALGANAAPTPYSAEKLRVKLPPHRVGLILCHSGARPAAQGADGSEPGIQTALCLVLPQPGFQARAPDQISARVPE